MTHKTQPTAHAEITAPISADLRRIDDAGTKSAPITLMTEDRACTWAWDQVQQDVGTKGWTAGDSCNFYGFFLWGWNYRGQYEAQRLAAPPAPAAVAVPDGFALVPKRLTRAMERVLSADEEGWQWEDLLAAAEAITEEEYAMLAAAPAQPDLRKHLRWALRLLRNDEGGCCGQRHSEAVHALERADAVAAWSQESAAPAQAVAVPIELQGVKEAAEQGSGFWRSCTGCHELNEGHDTGPVSKVFGCALGNGCSECGGIGAVWDDIDYGAMADVMATPAQEHATQLAGQGPTSEELMALSRECTKMPGGLGMHYQNYARAVLARWGAAPAQAQEDARDADGWYLQDTRSYVGNDVVWWAKNSNGYTTDVSKAHVFTREEAFKQAAMRGVDRAWPKEYIDGKTRPAVDMQYIKHEEAIAARAAQGGAA